jgi:hypothetical protein
MDQNEDPRELELKIEQAERIAARIGDSTTLGAERTPRRP